MRWRVSYRGGEIQGSPFIPQRAGRSLPQEQGVGFAKQKGPPAPLPLSLTARAMRPTALTASRAIPGLMSLAYSVSSPTISYLLKNSNEKRRLVITDDLETGIEDVCGTHALLVDAMAARHSILSFLTYQGSWARQ